MKGCTSEWVRKKHTDLAKKMMSEGKLDLHHEMSIELQHSRTVYEFNDVLDKYWKLVLEESA